MIHRVNYYSEDFAAILRDTGNGVDKEGVTDDIICVALINKIRDCKDAKDPDLVNKVIMDISLIKEIRPEFTYMEMLDQLLINIRKEDIVHQKSEDL